MENETKDEEIVITQEINLEVPESPPSDTGTNTTPPLPFNSRVLRCLKTSMIRVARLALSHSLSSQYYQSRNTRISIPGAVLGFGMGVLGFLSSSSMIGETGKVYIGITIGVGIQLSTTMGMLTQTLKYDTKADAHRKAAEAYKELLIKISFELAAPNEAEGFVDVIEDKMLKISKSCPYFTPADIESKVFNMSTNDILKAVHMERTDDVDNLV